jgi:hypothetical protein
VHGHDYLSTGAGDLKAAKRSLRRKFNQGMRETPVSRPGRLLCVTIRDGTGAEFLLGRTCHA